ncbi:ASN_HP2_G0020910.mRNA.1.CDS.1 [Saccharomyces cerevisiae]|nr:ASN_HP2_G0020910.mRNA.1.CDS.1 [Saccharomyces cerevisiae]CAI6485181.1 ASN_HP2_G0020910.mRNA.1.CDS.1 [Saccharomyces cerevisiae]
MFCRSIGLKCYYGADIVRWFLLEIFELEEDAGFGSQICHETRELLVSKWGNLINRCCGSKFNIERTFSVEVLARQGKFSIQEIFQNRLN